MGNEYLNRMGLGSKQTVVVLEMKHAVALSTSKFLKDAKHLKVAQKAIGRRLGLTEFLCYVIAGYYSF